MEYLTLQDIPHRHCEPLHSRKMTSSHSAERPLANMVAAVSHDHFSPFSISQSPPSPHPPHPPPPPPPPPHAVEPCVGLKCTINLPPTPFSYTSSQLPKSINPDGQERPDYHLPPILTSSTSSSSSSSSSPPIVQLGAHDHHSKRTFAPPNINLTGSQNHHMRSSPPLQPGEQNFPGKLPSFSEVRLFHAIHLFCFRGSTANLISFSTLHEQALRRGHHSAAMSRSTARHMLNRNLTM